MKSFGAKFLAEPSLFPRRISGEAWGAGSVVIELAGELHRVEGLSPTQASSLETRYGPRAIRGEAGSAAATLQVFRAPESDFLTFDLRGWEYMLDFQWSEEAVDVAGLQVMARADLAASRAGLWTPIEEGADFWGAVENVLRPILAARLLARGGLLVHSAAVNGWVFPSPSGGGKSTISRMAIRAGLPVLSDDLNAIVRDGAGLRILPLPFTGDLTEKDLSAVAQPLTAIVALEKGDRDETRPLPMAEAVSLLVRCAPYVNQDGHRTAALLDRAAEIATLVKRAVLTFRPGSDVWPILDSYR